MPIVSNMVKDIIEVFIDDFSIIRDSFDNYFLILSKVLQRYEEANLVLN